MVRFGPAKGIKEEQEQHTRILVERGVVPPEALLPQSLLSDRISRIGQAGGY